MRHISFKAIFITAVVILLPLQHPAFASGNSSEKNDSLSFFQRVRKSDFFLIRIFTRRGIEADSVVQHIEGLWSTANSNYSQRKFLDASHGAQQILSSWGPYLRALKRVRKKPPVNGDQLTMFIRMCRVYNNIYPSVLHLTSIGSTFPSDEETIVQQNRHELLAQIDSVRKEVQDTIEKYPEDKQAVQYAYRFVISAAERVDTLLHQVYDQERVNFSLKNRFYYNRMQESNNPYALKQFVDDCDYYGIDKEWCERARKILHPETPAVTSFKSAAVVVPPSPRKFAAMDMMHDQFITAVTSRNVELLETYIKKYSAKKYRKTAQIDSVKSVLNAVLLEIKQETAFASEHPYFKDATSTDQLFTVKFRGLKERAESIIQPVIDSFSATVPAIQSLRFPAVLLVDYTAVPPLYLLNAYVHEKKDITVVDSSGQQYAAIKGVPATLEVLDIISRRCTEQLKSNDIRFSYPPVFAVRILKNSQSYLTMYACSKAPDGYDIYNFYDVTTPSIQNIRIPHESKTISIKIPGDTSTEGNRVIREFFGK
ncbi:MAG TPA: hypothetical protein VHO70_13470 [Chitinispirillaceae bacterium]|nr:hypothetical protein [Chitinispirillaceae bacterium]